MLVSVCIVFGVAVGCKSGGDGGSSAPDPAAIKAQQELVARRDALLAQREKLESEAASLQAEIQKVEASGGDSTELARKKAAIEIQIQEQTTNLDVASSELAAITSKLDAAGGIALREARVAEREREIAQREREIAERERQLALRDAESAKRWAESCTAGAPQMIIQQVAPPKSGTYTRKEVDALFKRAKTAMAKKDLLPSDLGGGASLESEITKSLAESDWARGYILANQLVQTVDGIRIDRPFISAKYKRLHDRVKAAKVDEATQAKLDVGMREVMQYYGDGNFTAANRRINQLWTMI
jgi:chromosome segregation ATPase